MITLDKFTFLVLIDVLDSCSTIEYGNVESHTGYTKRQFEELYKKYNKNQKFTFEKSDLPIIIKGLEWMLVAKDDSDILQIDRHDGIKLINLLKLAKDKISIENWS